MSTYNFKREVLKNYNLTPKHLFKKRAGNAKYYYQLQNDESLQNDLNEISKIIVIGCPGAGKSTFSRKLSKITNLPLYHLDMLFHNADGTHISKEELEEKTREIFKKDKWIIDGNYQRTIETRMKESNTIFLLDYPLEVCLAGAEARVGKKRDDMPWVESELDEEFKQKIINFSKEKLPQIYDLLEKYKENKKIVVFKSREEADNYLSNINKIMKSAAVK